MWSPATKVREMGIACNQPLEEGYRAWVAGLGILTRVEGKTLMRLLRIRELVPVRRAGGSNWQG